MDILTVETEQAFHILMLVSFIFGMFTTWLFFQIDKLLTILVLTAHKHLSKYKNKGQDNKQSSDIVEH